MEKQVQVLQEYRKSGKMQHLCHSIKRTRRSVTLLSVPCKVLALILPERLQTIIEPQLLEA